MRLTGVRDWRKSPRGVSARGKADAAESRPAGASMDFCAGVGENRISNRFTICGRCQTVSTGSPQRCTGALGSCGLSGCGSLFRRLEAECALWKKFSNVTFWLGCRCFSSFVASHHEEMSQGVLFSAACGPRGRCLIDVPSLASFSTDFSVGKCPQTTFDDYAIAAVFLLGAL